MPDPRPIGLGPDLAGATDEQRELVSRIERGPRGSVPRPFLAMLDAPLLADAIQMVGVAIRYNGNLSDRHRELAILATAGAIGCDYEWRYHLPLGRAAGLSDDAIATARDGAFRGLSSPEAEIVDLCRQVSLTRRADDDLVADLSSTLGRRCVTELVAIAGYYGLLASFLSIGGEDTPLQQLGECAGRP